MPTARMDPDGALSFGAEYFQNTQRYDLGFQALPWLNVRFRYSGLDHFDPNFPVYWDRSFGAKIRLSNETRFFPEISAGATDLIGTGLFSGEYLVASKRFGDFDGTLGLGWGTLGSSELFRNPFGSISHSFLNRQVGGAPGSTDFGILFHGPTTGLFGGVTWHTPIEGLSVTTEYSSDDYRLQRERGNFTPRSQINYALTYKLNDATALSFGWLYGRSVEGHISFELDPTTTSSPQKIGPALPPSPPIRTPKEQQAALNLMLSAKQKAKRQIDFTQSESLVDRLWSLTSSITDIEIRGSTIVVSVQQGNSGLNQLCKNVTTAIGAQFYELSAVIVSNGKSRASCSVPRMSFAVMDQSVIGSIRIPTSLVTIDASEGVTVDPAAAQAAIRAEATRQRLTIAAINISGSVALVYYSNTAYFSEVDALERLVRLVMTYLPPEVERVRLIAIDGSVPEREFDFLRGPVERSFSQTSSIDFVDNISSKPAPMENPVLAQAERGTYPRFSWDVFPQFRQQLFDPTNPLGVQFVAALSGSVEFLPGVSISGQIEGNIWDNFDVNRPSDSVLPHVRTDYVQYFTKGKNGIANLQASYLIRMAPDVFALVKAGYLDNMFAGVGGETLWRPEGQRWAIGADLYAVQKRNFDRLFGLLGYRALTGHIALYYASPWYGLNFTVRSGQYLAQDRGLTFEISRRFSTGVEVGAFFTKTNISATQFGEGSFDKGIMLRIPLDWALPIDTQTELDEIIRPVQRDGGQRLEGDAVLYDLTRRTSEAEIHNLLAP